MSNGLPDFHEMIMTVMKISFKKHSPIERHYRDYKYFDQTKFKNNPNEKLSEGISNYESFETIFIDVLKKHSSLRKEFLRDNMLYTLQKPWGKLLCVGLNMRQNISKLKLKPTSNYTKSIEF